MPAAHPDRYRPHPRAMRAGMGVGGGRRADQDGARAVRGSRTERVELHGRCIASTNASLRAVVVGGPGLSGERHGATTARAKHRDELGNKDVEQNGRASRPGDGLPGFGHALYPDGDVRATYLLSRILPRHPQWKRMIDTGSTLVGQKPSLDLALVALRRHLRLPSALHSACSRSAARSAGSRTGWSSASNPISSGRVRFIRGWPDGAGGSLSISRTGGKTANNATGSAERRHACGFLQE